MTANTDDCWRRLTSSYFLLTGADLRAGDYDGGFYDYTSGSRFLNVTIGQGNTIVAASMQLRGAGLYGTIPETYINGEAVDDAATFSTLADFDDRTRTTAGVPWTPAAWVTNTWYPTPELKTIVQEIVDRGGWESGSDLVTFWRYDEVGWGSTQAQIAARSYDSASADAPKLDIDYTAGAEGVTVFAALATASALSYASTITTGLVIAGALATATALALAAKHVNSIPGAVATAAAKSYVATVSGAALIAAALSTATAKSYAATILAGDAVISAAVATASALAYAATHVNTIPAAVSTATAKSLTATVSGVAIVAGALATATAKSYDATVSGAALIGAALSTAAAKSYAAVVNPGVVVSAAVATASALVRAATIAAESAAGVTSSFLRWLR